MKIKIAILLLCILIKACMKSETNTNSEGQRTPVIKPLAQITYPADELSQKSFTYDTKGNLIKFNSISDTVYYLYTNNQINRKWIDAQGLTISEQVYTLDEKKRIIASTFTEGRANKIYETTYEYDSDGFLIKVLTHNLINNKENIIEHRYREGNLVFTRYLNGNEADMEVFYQYDTTKVNRVLLNVFASVDEFFTGNKLGKVSRNVLLQSLCKNVQNDTLSYLKYKNEFDREGYLIKTTEQDMINELSVEKLFHYKNR